ncbi:MAG: phosphohydrolase [Paludibacteraceae bacterium]|nr:phosphohydrolase [Paludibacteraceae bacterium]
MTLQEYIDNCILPRYDAFDRGHQRDHARSVISESLVLAREHHADEQMALVIAAYHDLGLSIDREHHHIHSGEILMADQQLKQWFTQEQLLTMRDAIEDHRASGKKPPRTIYGAIVAEADRQIEPYTILSRALFFGLKEQPIANFEWLFERAYQHMIDKYAEGGYMQLWLNSERNQNGLKALREIINDKTRMRTICEQIYKESISK